MSNTWIELDLSVLAENILNIRAAVNPRTEPICVVKSDAYGHGMIPVSVKAHACGVRRFALARCDEASALRSALPEAGIIILTAIGAEDVAGVIEQNISVVVVSEKHGSELAGAARKLGKTIKCHAKIDTGMGRLGFDWQQAPVSLKKLSAAGGLDFEGICTHLASSDTPDPSFANTQFSRFEETVKECSRSGLSIPFRHVSNSGGIVGDTGWDLEGVRPGIILYGYGPELSRGRSIHTRPFLHWKSRLIQVKKVPEGTPVSYGSTYITKRDTFIGTISSGYADGYSRLLSNKAFVLVGGSRKPVAGRVTMDLTVVDLGPELCANEGDEVVLIGSQGSESIWADEVARWRDTISYEVLTNIRATDRRIKNAN